MRCVAMASRGPLKPDTTDAGQALASRLWALGPPRANVTRGGPKESKEEPRRIRAAELEQQLDTEARLPRILPRTVLQEPRIQCQGP